MIKRMPEGMANRLNPEELGLLAKQLAAASDAIEAARIKDRLIRGFYGDSDKSDSAHVVAAD